MQSEYRCTRGREDVCSQRREFTSVSCHWFRSSAQRNAASYALTSTRWSSTGPRTAENHTPRPKNHRNNRIGWRGTFPQLSRKGPSMTNSRESQETIIDDANASPIISMRRSTCPDSTNDRSLMHSFLFSLSLSLLFFLSYSLFLSFSVFCFLFFLETNNETKLRLI